MPISLISCVTLPPATILSVPIYDFVIAHEELAKMDTEVYYTCCGKSFCRGCHYSSWKSGNDEKCPFCNSDRTGKTDEEEVGEIMKRVEANDPASIYMLAGCYQWGKAGFSQDHARAIELYVRAADLGYSTAHNNLGVIYEGAGNLKKAKFHFEAAAMAGDEVARFNVGIMEVKSGNMEQAAKHWMIAASAGHYKAMHALQFGFQQGGFSIESINTTLAAYNSSCAEMRSEARDAYIKYKIDRI
jgi:TPR repeat protein